MKIKNKPCIRNKIYIPTKSGGAYFVSFCGLKDQKEHFAVIYNQAEKYLSPVVRIHSECITGDIFRSDKCDCGDQLQEAIDFFSHNKGILLYLRQEGRGIGLYNKFDTYALQDQGLDTYEANRALHFPDDNRDYTVAAQMLKALSISQINLVTNNPNKVKQLSQLGITVVKRTSTTKFCKPHNQRYLQAKQKVNGHIFSDDTIRLLTSSKRKTT